MLRNIIQSMGRSAFQTRTFAFRMAGKTEKPQTTEPEYKGFESVDQIKKGKQNETKPWLHSDHLSASDEINHRGIDQRAKEWGVPVDKLEKLKPWEHHPAESKPELYKKTILGKEANLKKGYAAGSEHASQQHGSADFYDGKKVSGLTKAADVEAKAADRKFTDKDTTSFQVKRSEDSKKLSASDEINHRGIDQRAKEWGVSVDKLEKLKPWDHQAAESNIEANQKTILKGKDSFKGKSQGAQGFDNSKSRDNFNDLASGTHLWEGKMGENAAERKFSDRDTTSAQVKNAQNTNEMFDQGMVDKAMSWVKNKFGNEGTSKEGPTADHNATNKGHENHRDSVHKATFTKYEDSKKPFVEGQKNEKTEKKEVKDYLNH